MISANESISKFLSILRISKLYISTFTFIMSVILLYFVDKSVNEPKLGFDNNTDERHV